MALILPGNVASAVAGAYEVANSCMFNDGDDARISRTLGTATNIDKWTMSCWVKRCTLGANSSIFTSEGAGVSSTKGTIRFDSGDTLSGYILYDSGWKSFTTNEVFRDVSAWYHIVVAVDTTDSTATNRMKVYVNGTQITSFATYNAMDQNADTYFNDDTEHQIGSLIDESEDGDMYLSEFVFIDGTQYAASDFGEFDSDTPTVFKPIDVSGLTFGDNGAYLDFEDSDNLGDDESGNTNDWAETNLAATDQATDTPTNNFATLNPLSQGVAATSRTFSEGNTAVSFGGADDSSLSSIGVTSGKWYCEFKITNEATGYATVGVGNESSAFVTNPGACNIGSSAGAYGYFANGQKRINAASLADYGDTFTDDDIISIALDLENGAIWFAKNGTWQDSATAGEIAAGTTTNAAATSLSGTFFIGCSNSASGTTGDAFAVNFGNPSYANSSDAADGNGYGAFEYAPPSGYYALCTKNLAEYG